MASPQSVIGDYIVTRKIGSGSFAEVWKGEHKVHGTEVAIKEIKTEKLNRKLKESLESEIAILKRANHPNIIKLLEIVQSSDRIFLIMEYCAGGDLSAYIRQHGRVDEALARHFMRHLAAGLQILWTNNLIHRDLKPQNLLLSTNDERAVLKIADFGFARSLHPQKLAETLCGSPLYMAPEILKFQTYNAKADLWSVGAILFELVAGRPPYNGANHIQLLNNIEKAEARVPPAIAAQLSDHCLSLVRSLLQRDPGSRLSFEKFFHHSFLEPVRESMQQRSEEPSLAPLHGVQAGPSSRTPSGTADYYGLAQDNSRPREVVKQHTNMQHELRQYQQQQQQQQQLRSGREHVHSADRGKIQYHAAGARGDLAAVGWDLELDSPRERDTGRVRVDAANVNDMYSEWKHSPDALPVERKGYGVDTADMRRYGQISPAVMKYKGPPATHSGELVEAYRVPLLRDGYKGIPEPPGLISALSTDSMDGIEKEYILVDKPLYMSSELSSPHTSGRRSARCDANKHNVQMARSPSPTPQPRAHSPAISVPGTPGKQSGRPQDVGSRGSTPSSSHNDATAAGSATDARQLAARSVPEGPAAGLAARVASLQKCARLVSELAADKMEAEQPLESLSIQLVCLAIWREALGVCHAWAELASDVETERAVRGHPPSAHLGQGSGSGSHDRAAGVPSHAPGSFRQEGASAPAAGVAEEDVVAAAAAACAMVESEFLVAVERAEEVAKYVEPADAAKMPDAMELIFQAALAVGRAAAVEELMGNFSNAAVGYAKASALFYFFLLEAPALSSTPPFVLALADRQRIQRYADAVVVRQNFCTLQRTVLLQQQQQQPHLRPPLTSSFLALDAVL